MNAASKILGPNGQPYRNGHAQNGHARATRQDLLDLIAKTYDDRARKRRAQAAGGDIHAKYDAAQSSPDFDNYWSNADARDADSANSKNVRARLVQRSRYEVGNNGYADGMVQTHANFVVGTGPKLRMKTRSAGFNAIVERAPSIASTRLAAAQQHDGRPAQPEG